MLTNFENAGAKFFGKHPMDFWEFLFHTSAYLTEMNYSKLMYGKEFYKGQILKERELMMANSSYRPEALAHAAIILVP